MPAPPDPLLPPCVRRAAAQGTDRGPRPLPRPLGHRATLIDGSPLLCCLSPASASRGSLAHSVPARVWGQGGERARGDFAPIKDANVTGRHSAGSQRTERRKDHADRKGQTKAVPEGQESREAKAHSRECWRSPSRAAGQREAQCSGSRGFPSAAGEPGPLTASPLLCC